MLRKLFDLFKSSSSQPSLGELAAQIGIERREFPRALYPACSNVGILPNIQFEDFVVKAKDVSLGGFCITSNALADKLKVNGDYEFQLCWPGTEQPTFTVVATHIAVSFEKLHFQFKTISDEAKEHLIDGIRVAEKGLHMRPSYVGLNAGIQSDVSEIWVNTTGDQVIVSKQKSAWLTISFMGESFSGGAKDLKEHWTDRENLLKRKCLLVFLVNIPSPSEEIIEAIQILSTPYQSREIA